MDKLTDKLTVYNLSTINIRSVVCIRYPITCSSVVLVWTKSKFYQLIIIRSVVSSTWRRIEFFDHCNIGKNFRKKMKILIQILVFASLATLILAFSLYGESCEESSDCEASGNLQCVDSQCGCLPGFTRNSRNTCWRAYGEQCEWILDCNVDTLLKCNDTTNTCDCQQPGTHS